MKILNFQQRLLAGVIMLIITTTITLGFVGSHLAASFLRQRFEDRMSFLAKYLALNAELGILIDDRAMLKRLAQNLLSEKDVVTVIITGPNGRELVKAGKEAIDSSSRGIVSTAVRLTNQGENLAFLKNSTYNRLIGKVTLIYSVAGIKQLQTRLRNRYILAALGLGLLGLIGFFLFSRSLLAPLSTLVKASRQVAAGDLSTRIKGGALPETQELAEAFNSMLESLAESRRNLEETYQEMIEQRSLAKVGRFALTVAHEVKNPLGIIKGALDILKKPEIDQELRSTMIQYVEDEIRRLNKLIQDFLDFSRPRKLTFQDTDMGALLSELVERMRLEWDSKGMKLNTQLPDAPCVVQADADMLSRAILNIIKNACEACGEEGNVLIKAWHQNPNLVITISDTGTGIDRKARERLFDPFFTTKAKGTGLGLAFARQVIEAHGGRIDLLEESKDGTTFKIVLPGSSSG